MILLSELSRRRIRSIQKLIRVGRNEVVVVLRVDKEKGIFLCSQFSYIISQYSVKGYIDLSKRRVSPEDLVKCEERFMKSKTVASILRHVASKLSSVEAPARPGQGHGKGANQKESDDIDDSAVPAGSSEEERLEQLYEQIAWPLGRQYGHPYDAFKLALTYVDLLLLHCSAIDSFYAGSPKKCFHPSQFILLLLLSNS